MFPSVWKLRNVVPATKIFPNLLVNTFALEEANFVLARTFPSLPRAFHMRLWDEGCKDGKCDDVNNSYW